MFVPSFAAIRLLMTPPIFLSFLLDITEATHGESSAELRSICVIDLVEALSAGLALVEGL
jgi:hypothetical protein